MDGATMICAIIICFEIICKKNVMFIEIYLEDRILFNKYYTSDFSHFAYFGMFLLLFQLDIH